MRVRVAALVQSGNSLLLVRHEKELRSYWLLPGGGVHLGEQLRDAIKREIKEELNLDGEAGELLFVVESLGEGNNHIIQPTFKVGVRNMRDLKLGRNKRVTEFRFFNQDEIASLTVYPDIKYELEEYLARGKLQRKYVFKKWIE